MTKRNAQRPGNEIGKNELFSISFFLFFFLPKSSTVNQNLLSNKDAGFYALFTCKMELKAHGIIKDKIYMQR